MIDRLLLGESTLKIDGFNTDRLVAKIQKSCKVISLYTKNDSIYLTTLGIHERRIRRLCEDSKSVCETLSKKGALFVAVKYVKRYGFAVGVIAIAALTVFLSNTVMKIEITGASDEAVLNEVRELLEEEGVKPGAYIPSINFLQLSTKLFTSSDEIAWASVGATGSIIHVNLNMLTDKTPYENRRIPCNIVSTKDAVIVDARVKVGRLNVLLGDAVYKGQMLVSGVQEFTSGSIKYYHAYADIIGRYSESIVLTQNYEDETVSDGEHIYRKSLKLFEFEIPLPGHLVDKSKQYRISSAETPVKLIGITLPLSVKTYEYTTLNRETTFYTTEEAYASLEKKIESYEKNFLADVDIQSRELTWEENDSGVSVRVDYVLEGSIGEPQNIYQK